MLCVCLCVSVCVIVPTFWPFISRSKTWKIRYPYTTPCLPYYYFAIMWVLHYTVGPRFSDILGGKVFLSLNRGVTKSGSNAINFLYRGKFIMSLNRGVTKSGVTKSGSDCNSLCSHQNMLCLWTLLCLTLQLIIQNGSLLLWILSGLEFICYK